ncbi:uncharacterized protein EV154DRAFT_549941 [Mucor mucedo]|uniref:uncharacterized protein n=1 Tax=Mucor mucedo TaxID=29922 RepID=UPI00221E9752|nr:uncharacterized protein EV154DRAFT_549941 [Mucor mucedo]KAI7893371.1 hypothetical protein EV154DRAFT_549941 [Mucor mucedo]
MGITWSHFGAQRVTSPSLTFNRKRRGFLLGWLVWTVLTGWISLHRQQLCFLFVVKRVNNILYSHVKILYSHVKILYSHVKILYSHVKILYSHVKMEIVFAL